MGGREGRAGRAAIDRYRAAACSAARAFAPEAAVEYSDEMLDAVSEAEARDREFKQMQEQRKRFQANSSSTN